LNKFFAVPEQYIRWAKLFPGPVIL